jgi:hypothetical protein
MNIDHMFYEQFVLKDGKYGFADFAHGPGIVTNTVRVYSEMIMLLPPEIRVHIGRGVMQMVQETLQDSSDSAFDDPAQTWEKFLAILVSKEILPRAAVMAAAYTWVMREDTVYTIILGMAFSVIPFVAPLETAHRIVKLIEFIDYLINEVIPQIPFEELAKSLATALITLKNTLTKWFNENFNAGYKYATENPQIKIDTAEMREQAQEIALIQQGFDEVAQILEAIHLRTGNPALGAFLRKNKVGKYRALDDCISYLNTTADEFDKVEAEIQKAMAQFG